jgi:hypothetical protein
MDVGDQRDRLGKVDVHRLVGRQVLVVGIRNLHRAVLDANRTTRAVILDNVPGLFSQGDLEVSCFTFDLFNFGIGQYLDVRMPADLDQFG